MPQQSAQHPWQFHPKPGIKGTPKKGSLYLPAVVPDERTYGIPAYSTTARILPTTEDDPARARAVEELLERRKHNGNLHGE